MCVCIPAVCVCVLSFASSQLKLANLPRYLQSPCFLSPPLSHSSSFPSLSPMNRLNFLMSCFYGLLMLIHSSPYALFFHPSISLSPSTHPSSPSHSCLPGLAAATMFISTGTRVYTGTHIHSLHSKALMCAHTINR